MGTDSADIVQSFLDRQSEFILAGDLGGYLSTISLPHRRLTLTHDALIETPQQAEQNFAVSGATLRSLGIDLFMRHLETSRRLGPDYVEGIYVSHLWRGSSRGLPSYEGRVVLGRRAGDWRMVENERSIRTIGSAVNFNAMQQEKAPDIAFVKGDVRETGADPAEVYASYLAALSDSERAGDFDAYLAMMRMPLTAHWHARDVIVAKPEDCRQFFDMVKQTYTGEVSDDLERRISHAEFVGADMLVGYHTAHAVRDGRDVMDAVASRYVLKFSEGRWRAMNIANALTGHDTPSAIHAPRAPLPMDLDIQERTKEWPNFLRTRTVTA
ncbi:MAG: hypothetical protein AAF601_15935 [Pseudomonadota bacterium]